MAEIKVRKTATVANTPVILHFDVMGLQYLVKNNTDDYIHVALKSDATVDECISIPPECAQVILASKIVSADDGSNEVYIIPEGTSQREVEVQCILW
jgi:hypothetical protein